MLQLVQIVSFGLLLSLLTLNGAECHCNYFQNLEPGQTYYVYNPTYPNYTRGENNCMWKMSSDYNIEIQCDIEMLSYNCDLNSLFFQFVENNAPMEEYYCTNRTFGPRRLSGDAAIEFNSHIDTKGARFLCKMKTLYNNNNCDCGWKKVTRIVGGKETGINEYPMMCGLVDNSENSGEIYCGGTIISHLYVLTAAHCIETRNIQKDIAVVIGEHNVKTNTETSATRVLRLKGCISHPLYYSSTDAFDIAVCKTVENIIFSAEVGPACLPFLHKRNTFENEIVTALGWGTLEFAGKASDTLQKVDLKVIPNQICKENSLNVNSNNMCTYADGKDTCQRDSGGPLLWKDRSTDRCVLVGVTSTGAGCAAAGTPAVAMRVGAFIDWIKFVTPDAEYCQIE